MVSQERHLPQPPRMLDDRMWLLPRHNVSPGADLQAVSAKSRQPPTAVWSPARWTILLALVRLHGKGFSGKTCRLVPDRYPNASFNKAMGRCAGRACVLTTGYSYTRAGSSSPACLQAPGQSPKETPIQVRWLARWVTSLGPAFPAPTLPIRASVRFRRSRSRRALSVSTLTLVKRTTHRHD